MYRILALQISCMRFLVFFNKDTDSSTMETRDIVLRAVPTMVNCYIEAYRADGSEEMMLLAPTVITYALTALTKFAFGLNTRKFQEVSVTVVLEAIRAAQILMLSYPQIIDKNENTMKLGTSPFITEILPNLGANVYNAFAAIMGAIDSTTSEEALDLPLEKTILNK